MLRSIPRTARILQTPSVQRAPLAVQSRSANTHAISNPTLAGIEKRWEEMQPQEQAQLWMDLRDRMKVDWKELTLQERKAGEFNNNLFFSDVSAASLNNAILAIGLQDVRLTQWF